MFLFCKELNISDFFFFFQFVPIEKGFDFVINAQYWTEGHPFRSYVLDPAKPHEHGIKGDKVFVNKGADHLWTVNELACSSVSGKACNANKAKNIPAVENNTLEPTKMDALEGSCGLFINFVYSSSMTYKSTFY